MNLLLDTHYLIWWATDDPRLGPAARTLLADPAHQLVFSSISILEVAIKHSKGLLKLPADLLQQSSVDAGLVHLPFTARHACRTAQLPKIHQDPFDRALIAQALEEPLTLLSRDPWIQQYAVLVESL